MKVIPFWGCMIALKYPQMEKAVRYSLENPAAYIQSNDIGFFNTIESAKNV